MASAWIFARAMSAGEEPYSVSGRCRALSSISVYSARTAPVSGLMFAGFTGVVDCGVEPRLDQRRRGEHQQLGEVLRLDLGVGHAGQELHLPVHHHAADVARRAREEHAIHAARAAESGAVAFPVVLVLGGAHLGQQQAGVAEDAACQQPSVVDGGFGRRQRLERARVLEAETEGQRRSALAGRARDAVHVVGRVGADADVIRSSIAWRQARSGGQFRLTLPDARDPAQRRVLVFGIEVEDGLEEDERHPVEADGVVEEPVPGQPRMLSAAEPVFLRPARVAVVRGRPRWRVRAWRSRLASR